MTDAGNDAAGSGQNQSHGEQGAVTPAQLDALKAEILGSVNGAITGHLKRFDIAAQVQAALESTKDAGETKATGAAQSSKANPELDTLRKQLETTNAELSRERKSTAIRTALTARGLSGTALEDAAALLATRDDITSEVDATGRRLWQGTVSTDLGPVSKPLEEMVGSWLKERPQLLPASHRGGTGAQGGTPGSNGSNGPTRLADMTAEEIQADPAKARQLARQERNKQRSTSPWG